MNGNDSAISLELYAMTARLLLRLAAMWGVSAEEAIRRAMEQADPATEVPLKEVRLTYREGLLLIRIIEGYTCEEIAHELEEDPVLTRYGLNKVRSKVHNRLKAQGTPVRSSRLEVFKALQRNLSLTPAKAAEWQDSIREARR